MLSGNVATQVQSGVNLVNVRVWTPTADRIRVDQIGALMLKSPADGHLLPDLRESRRSRLVTGQAEINRENMRRMDAVTARVVGRDVGSTAAEVSKLVSRPGFLPAGMTFEMGGLYAEQKAAFRGMAMVFAAAVAAVFVLLLVIYESFRIAATIVVMPIAAATAVAIGLWLDRRRAEHHGADGHDDDPRDHHRGGDLLLHRIRGAARRGACARAGRWSRPASTDCGRSP